IGSKEPENRQKLSSWTVSKPKKVEAMMSLTVKQKIFNQATQLQERLAFVQESIDHLRPAEQIRSSIELQGDCGLMKHLQQKVTATFHRQTDGISGISEEELINLYEKLNASAKILEAINKNIETASQYLEIASEIETSAALNGPQMHSLQERIRGLNSPHPFLNRGNREAVQVLESALQAMQDPPLSPITQRKGSVQRAADYLHPQTTMRDEEQLLQRAQEALKNLHMQMQKALTASDIDQTPFFPHIHEAYQKITHGEKVKIFDALNAILKEQRMTNDLPDRLRKMSINQWPGSLQQKKGAVERVLLTTIAQVTVVKEGHEIKQRLNEAKNLQPRSIFPTFDMNRGFYRILAAIHSLQFLFFLFQENAGDRELREASNLLQRLDSEARLAIFQMSDEKHRSIAERPRFHLYFIHKNKTRCVYAITNEERLRSVQRTIVELALGALELPIYLGDDQTVKNLIDLLEDERMKLNTEDRVNGQYFVAYNLFYAFYNLQISARAHHSFLIDPHDPQFEGAFGRVGFIKSMAGIDPAIKIMAIKQVRDELKAAWKIL
ncbi:MAG: hypothetical protein WA347_02480, partial [Rhabdochlamydiaceae bacterium]